MGACRPNLTLKMDKSMKLKVKKLHASAVIPAYATSGAACFDLVAINDGKVPALGHATFDTGLSFEVPEGFVLMAYSRSGHGFKSNIRLANCVGVIDSDYRGEVRVKLTNDGPHPFQVSAGDRICQAMIIPVPSVELVEVADLGDTERGDCGFGSTGS